jgi:hypothetical protein
MSYRVIKDIPNGIEVRAKVGDILTVAIWGGKPTLIKNRKAVCEIGSTYEKKYCEEIKDKPKAVLQKNETMSEIDKLTQLMGQGWNINIKCKGKGRNFEMTFEAVAQKVLVPGMTTPEQISCMVNQVHAVGNTMKQVLENLESKMTTRNL